MKFVIYSTKSILVGAALALTPSASAFGDMQAQLDESSARAFPGDSFQPTTPLRAIPGDTFTPAQLRALQRERIMTAADFLEADRRVLARVLGVNSRQAGRMQAEMRGRLSTDASARGIQPEEGGEDLFAPDQSFPGDSFARQRGFPGDSFSGELSFPGDSFDPATPLRAFPGDSFTPAQLRALQRERIRTAADLAEANPRVVGRALGVSPREAERLQTEMRRRFTQ